MSEILFHYHKVNATTWVYLSSLLMIGLFFKFNRTWSVRNLDLILLILLAPGLVLVQYGEEMKKQAAAALARETVAPDAAVPEPAPPPAERPGSAPVPEFAPPPDRSAPEAAGGAAPSSDSRDDMPPETAAAGASVAATPADQLESARSVERLGYIWLFVTGAILLVRFLVDPTMVRRPLLEPNLSVGGMVFIGCALFVFLMANVIVTIPTEDDKRGALAAEQLMSRRDAPVGDDLLTHHGPGYTIFSLLPHLTTTTLVPGDRQLPPQERSDQAAVITAKVMAFLSHLAVVIALIVIGYRHFDNIRMGVGMAMLYLMLPYTAQMTGRVDHVLPAALLLWAVVFYRRPEVSGVLLGLAMGVVYYPLFLLPLWVSFYWQRGLMRFALSVAATLALLVLSLAFTSSTPAVFWLQVQKMFGLWLPLREGLSGFWAYYPNAYRIPVLATVTVLSIGLSLWPAQKNLGTLISCSGAVMLATQFWHGFGGGTYMAWYLPLLLCTIFRPNLEDRVALAVLGEGWFRRRRTRLEGVEKAA
jgi:hypothetical protein